VLKPPGVCWALGYPDGNTLPVEKLAALVGTITDAIHVPLSVDVEGGYTDDPKKIAQNLKPILEAGAIGVNIEDGEGEPELLARKIEQVRKTAESAGVKLFVKSVTGGKTTAPMGITPSKAADTRSLASERARRHDDINQSR
jgi:2-methylisocitrate lyase-like PEP mutase family enzyme